MLSKHERDRLAEIEAALVSADPEFAERFERFDGSSTWQIARRMMLFALLSIVGLTSVVFLVSGLLWTSAGLAGVAVLGTVALFCEMRRDRAA